MRATWIFLTFLSLTGCYYDKLNELHPLNGTTNICSTDTPATYSGSIKTILALNCTSCHNHSIANGGINLDNYLDARAIAISGRLIGSVTHEAGLKAMPPGASIRQCEIEKIRSWIQNEMPE